MPPYPNDEEEDDDDDIEADFQEDEDDDDDEEDDEYHLGDDDDDENKASDDNNIDDDDDQIVPLLDGKLSLQQDGKLVYEGDGFHLTSAHALGLNILDSSVQLKGVLSLTWQGTCEIMTQIPIKGKPAPRTLQVTIEQVSEDMVKSNGLLVIGRREGESAVANLKGGDDNEEEDTKKPAAVAAATKNGDDFNDRKKPPPTKHSIHYRIFASQIRLEKQENELLEFQGFFSPVPANGDANKNQHHQNVPLLCQARMVPSSPSKTGGAAPAAAAAARKPTRSRHNDNDDEEEDADEDVDYEELIALHQDAGLPVDALKKRYAEQEAQGPASKRGKASNDDDDAEVDDDEYGF